MKLKAHFTKETLQEFLRLNDKTTNSRYRTINSYIKKGILPPDEFITNDERGWSQEVIFELLGLKRDLEEPFMTTKEAAEYLEYRKIDFASFVRSKKVPHYQLYNGKGVHPLFLKSELDKFLEIRLTQVNDWIDNPLRSIFLTNILKAALHPSLTNSIEQKDLDIIMSILIEKKTFTHIAAENKLTNHSVANRFRSSCDRIIKRIEVFNKNTSITQTLLDDNIRLRSENQHLCKLMNLNKIEERELFESQTQTTFSKLSCRSRNFLAQQGIDTINQLTDYKLSHIRKHQNIGKKTVLELSEYLLSCGVDWREE